LVTFGKSSLPQPRDKPQSGRILPVELKREFGLGSFRPRVNLKFHPSPSKIGPNVKKKRYRKKRGLRNSSQKSLLKTEGECRSSITQKLGRNLEALKLIRAERGTDKTERTPIWKQKPAKKDPKKTRTVET